MLGHFSVHWQSCILAFSELASCFESPLYGYYLAFSALYTGVISAGARAGDIIRRSFSTQQSSSNYPAAAQKHQTELPSSRQAKATWTSAFKKTGSTVLQSSRYQLKLSTDILCFYIQTRPIQYLFCCWNINT